MSDVYPLPGTSGLTFDATFLPLLLSSPFALPAFSFLLPVFLKFQQSFVFVVLLKDQLFCLAHDSWSVIGAACCHMALIVQQLCESRGGRPGLSVLTSLLVSVDVKLY